MICDNHIIYQQKTQDKPRTAGNGRKERYMKETEDEGHTISFTDFPATCIATIMEDLRKSSVQLTEDVKITLLQPKFFDENRQNSLWHGGDMVRIELPIGQFIISADGDVYVSLFRTEDSTELFYVKDKNNRGELGTELLPYVKTDEELMLILNDEHPDYTFDMSHNNWWECYAITKEGKFRDLMWALDADTLSDAVAEVLCGYKEYASYM